jgi:hypothetical protein
MIFQRLMLSLLSIFIFVAAGYANSECSDVKISSLTSQTVELLAFDQNAGQLVFQRNSRPGEIVPGMTVRFCGSISHVGQVVTSNGETYFIRSTSFRRSEPTPTCYCPGRKERGELGVPNAGKLPRCSSCPER